MTVRIRLPELLNDRGLTAYRVALDSKGRIDQSHLYRLMRQRGRVDLISAELLDALCDVLKVAPCDLIEREPAKPKRAR